MNARSNNVTDTSSKIFFSYSIIDAPEPLIKEYTIDRYKYENLIMYDHIIIYEMFNNGLCSTICSL